MKIVVTLNGGPKNVWHTYGLRCNPFPQIGKFEFATANRMLRELDSDPLTGPEDIRRILKGCDHDFIELCCSQFKAGERIQFTISWPDP